MTKKVLITGGTGLIGSKITELLLRQGIKVHCLSRSSQKGEQISYYKWNVNNQTIDKAAFDGVDGIIHLAGAGIADKRWSAERKKEIMESRTRSTQLLYTTLSELDHTVNTFVGASAIGWYGETGDALVTEEAPPGRGFMADVVKAWEAEVSKIRSLGIRLAIIRVGIVLSSQGGALPEMARPVKLFAGAALGSGKQYLSWVHEDDMARIFVHAYRQAAVEGVYNGVAPHPATNQEMTSQISNVLKRPLFLPNVPEFALRALLGEMADMVLIGTAASSKKIEATGFTFQYPELKHALSSLF